MDWFWLRKSTRRSAKNPINSTQRAHGWKNKNKAIKIGKIIKIGNKHNFGIIESIGESYLFLPSGFRTPLPEEHWQYLMGKEVSYSLSAGKSGKAIAVDIVIMPSNN